MVEHLDYVANLEKSNITQELLNGLTGKINNIFIGSAKTTFSEQTGELHTQQNTNTRYKNNTDKNTKPWYTKECKIARKGFHRAKYQYKLRKNFQNLDVLKLKSNVYKTTLNKAYKQFKLRKVKKNEKA